MHLREDFFCKKSKAFFGLLPRHPAVHHVDHDLLHADGLLHRLNLLDYLVRGADRLSRATRGESGLRRTYIGGLSRQVFLVATYALVAWVVPIEVVVLRRDAWDFVRDPSFFGFVRGFGAVHPQQGGGLVRW